MPHASAGVRTAHLVDTSTLLWALASPSGSAQDTRSNVVRRTVIGVSVIVATAAAVHSQRPSRVFVPSIPRTWDDAALSMLEVPLPDRAYSPKAVPSDYYYRIPVRPILRTYPVYLPGKGPKEYLASLRERAPEILWDDNGHHPRLETEADWIKAGGRNP